MVIIIVCFSFDASCVGAAKNPYKKTFKLNGVEQNNCTYFAWQYAHDKAGISLPGWGNASTWYNSAKKAGFEVGQTPKNNSIIVTSFHNNGKNLGHVEYVEKVDGDILYTWGTSTCRVNDYPPLVKCLSVIEDVPAGVDTIDEYLASLEEKNKCYKKYTIPKACEDHASAYTHSDLLIGYIYLDNPPKVTTTKKTTTTKKQIITTKPTITTSPEVLKSSNSYLSSLTIDNIKFDFNKEIFEYKIDVLNDVREINIKGVSEDEQASVEGLGMHLLNEGTNIIEIIVKAQDGSQKIYSLYINRKEETTKIATLTTEKKSKEEQNNKVSNYIFIVGVVIMILALMGIVIILFRKWRS